MAESNQYEHRAAPTLYSLHTGIDSSNLTSAAWKPSALPRQRSRVSFSSNVRARTFSFDRIECMQKWYMSDGVWVCVSVRTKSIHAQVLDVCVWVSGCECDGPFCVCASHTSKTLCGPSRRCDGNGYGVYGFHRRCYYTEWALHWWKQHRQQHWCQMLLLLLDLLFHHLIRFVYISTAKCMPGCVFFSFFVRSRSLWKWM